MAEEKAPELEDNLSDSYNAPKKVSLEQLSKMDQEDESLRKYKEALLGKAVSSAYSPKDDPRRVVIVEMKVIAEGRPGGDITYNLDSPEKVKAFKDQPFVLKEGCNYKIQVAFRVQHEIVSGLKYLYAVSRAGINVGKEDLMLGSFPPQETPHTQTFPRMGWDECPKGMMARGKYKAKARFLDDDKVCHLEYEYTFEIKKDWD